MTDLICPACDQAAVAEVAGGDATVLAADDHSVCELRPNQHESSGFRWFVHND